MFIVSLCHTYFETAILGVSGIFYRLLQAAVYDFGCDQSVLIIVSIMCLNLELFDELSNSSTILTTLKCVDLNRIYRPQI